MSDLQNDGMKKKGCTNNLFIINGIINDVIKNKNQDDIDIQIYDVKKCFDKLWFAETANDFYNVGVNDDHFVTIANSNKDCDVAVRTPWGAVT